MMSPASSRVFAGIVTQSLTGRVVRLPDDLPGSADVLVLAFRRGQQDDVDRWRSAVEGAPGLPVPGFWEVPIVETRMVAGARLDRWRDDSGDL
jgi:hypothetical protein